MSALLCLPLVVALGLVAAACTPPVEEPPGSTTTTTTTSTVPGPTDPTITGEACRPGSGVTVVVDFTALDDSIRIGCAAGEQASGLAALAAAGFTVGSAESISGRLRSMWSETREGLGDGAPAFKVTSDEVSGPARIVQGTFEAPKYLTGDGGPGTVLANGDDPDGTPVADGTMDIDFFCTVPAAATGAKPAGSVIYGHGLLGTRTQTLDIGLLGASVGMAFCGLDYLGMSAADVAPIVASFEDLSDFRTVPDRLQQGHLTFLLLGRLLRSADGFVLARLVITCCAADAFSVTAQVVTRTPAPGDNAWVRVTGRFAGAASDGTPRLRSSAVVSIPAPANPYD